MQRKALLLPMALLPALAITTALLMHQPPQPTYEGRSLETWVMLFNGPEGQPTTKRAITTIVTNCLPSLIQQLKYDPGPHLARMAAIAKVVPSSLMTKTGLGRFIHEDYKERRASIASLALSIAGPAARAAVPELREIAIKTNCPASTRAMQALIRTDDNPAPTLAAIILNPNHPARYYALTSGADSQTTTPELIQFLIPAVTNSNKQIASVAVEAIGELARRYNHSIDFFIQRTELLVPTLQRATTDPREQVSDAAKQALKILTIER